MKQHQGIFLPDHEQHMIEWMNKSGELVDGRGTYQIKKLRAALTHVKQWRAAVDVGAHVGFWSMHLVKKFIQVHAFEPIEEHRLCFQRNVTSNYLVDKIPVHWTMHTCALGAFPGMVALTIPHGSSGGTHISGAGDIEMRTLDSFAFENVDFIKIDCEGAELAVLQGAVETLKRWKPCVIVEQKPHIMQANFGTKGRPAVDFLLSLGAQLRKEISGDYILSW